MEELYKDINYCRQEILHARQIMTTVPFTEEQAKNLIKGLSFVYLYGPEELTMIAKATIDEVMTRSGYIRNRELLERVKK